MRVTYNFSVPREEIVNAPDEYHVDQAYIKPWLDELKEKYEEVLSGYSVVSHGMPLDATHYDFTVEAEVIVKFNHCHNCGREIKVAIFRGGEWCSDDCRKALGKDVK